MDEMKKTYCLIAYKIITFNRRLYIDNLDGLIYKIKNIKFKLKIKES